MQKGEDEIPELAVRARIYVTRDYTHRMKAVRRAISYQRNQDHTIEAINTLIMEEGLTKLEKDLNLIS